MIYNLTNIHRISSDSVIANKGLNKIIIMYVHIAFLSHFAVIIAANIFSDKQPANYCFSQPSSRCKDAWMTDGTS